MTVAVKSPVRYSHCIGFFAEVGRGFSNPYDVAPGPDDLLYVLNRSNGADAPLGGMRVTTCKVDSEYLGEWSQYGDGPGQLVWPTAIVMDRQGRLWIADEHRHDVQAFETDGRCVGRVGGFGTGPGQLNRPAGLALDADGSLIVGDAHNNRVQKLSPDGACLAVWGSAGAGPGQLNLPWGVAVDRRGHVYVADWRNDRVQELGPDGQPLAIYGADGPAEARLKRPSGVAVDDDGLVYVADWGNNRVAIYEPDGALAAILEGDADLSPWAREYLDSDAATVELRERAAHPEQEKRFWGPTGIKLDAAGRLYVVESCRHRMQVYQKQ
jgi:DNA-binding beta-propeller fold protein YncE